MDTLTFLITVLFLSIPEMIFVNLFVIRYEKHSSIFNIAIVCIFVSVILDYVKYIANIDPFICILIGYITMAILITVLNKYGFPKVLLLCFLAVLAIIISDMLVFPIYYFVFHITQEHIDKHVFLKIALSLPSRGIEGCIIWLLYKNRR